MWTAAILLGVQSVGAEPSKVAPLPPEAVEGTVAPQVISIPAVHRFYPPEAKQRGEQGATRLLCTLSAEGRLRDCTLHLSSGFADLDNAAFDLAASARYRSMYRHGVAVETRAILPVQWLLADDSGD